MSPWAHQYSPGETLMVWSLKSPWMPYVQKWSTGGATASLYHSARQERDLWGWFYGHLDELARERTAIQKRLPKNGSAKVNSNLARSFSNVMFGGKSKAAQNLLFREQKVSILHLDDLANPDDPNSPSVRESLISRQPVGQPVYNSSIIHDEPQDPHPVIFESLGSE